MRVEHLIDGRPVAGRSYFETVDPATQDVLAEVARGGADEIDAAVTAAKGAFPAWAKTPPAERARLMSRLGDLIAAHVPALSETETRDTGQVIAQTRKQLVPRAADNFHYFAEVCMRVDGHTYPTPTHLNYTLYQPVGVCALISPVERAVHDRDLEGRAVPGARQHRGAEDERAVAAHGGAPRRARARGRHPGRRAQRRPRLRRRGGRGAGRAPRRACDLVHRIDANRQPHRQGGRAEEVLDGARRQEPVRRLRRCRPRSLSRRGRLHDLLEQRRALHRRIADPGPAIDLRRVRGALRRTRAAHRRSATRSTRRRSSGR